MTVAAAAAHKDVLRTILPLMLIPLEQLDVQVDTRPFHLAWQLGKGTGYATVRFDLGTFEGSKLSKILDNKIVESSRNCNCYSNMHTCSFLLVAVSSKYKVQFFWGGGGWGWSGGIPG